MTPKLPIALFSCGNKFCADECSYHADQLCWSDSSQKWICDFCWENLPEGTKKGIRLDKRIASLNLPATALLKDL